MNTVRCKFECDTAKDGKVFLRAVYDPNVPEDRKFCKATPWGNFEMQVDNPNVDGFFVAGKKYYIDITHAE
jgi:hypothetical protein